MRHSLIDAARALSRRPGFTLVAILTLAVGIGASSAVFGVVHAVVLRPLPFADAERLVVMEPRRVSAPETVTEAVYVDVMAWRGGLDSFDDVAAFASGAGRIVALDGDAQRVPGKLVTWNFFAVLGMVPTLGRDFTEEDGRPGAAKTAIIHESLWGGLFGADQDIVGRTITLDGEPTAIIGVMPSAADFPVGDRIWSPVGSTVSVEMLESVGTAFLNPFGRLAQGTSPDVATAELDAYLREVVNQRGFGDANDVFARLSPFSDAVMGDTRTPLLILLGATLLVLLTACANVANLQLVRALDRQRDATIRLALGADPGRLARHALAESVILAAAGAALGVVLASVAAERALAATPVLLFRGEDVAMNVAVLLFTIGVSVGVAVAAGTVPAVYLARRSPQALLRSGAGTLGTGATRTLSGLVTLQVALAVTLLVGAGLLGRTFVALYGVETGFDRAGTLTFRLPLLLEEYDDEATDRFFDDVIDGVEGLAGVERAGGVLLRPLQTPYGYDYSFTVESRPSEEQPSYPFANYQAVTPGYFEAMGIALHAGRDFGFLDDADASRVAIVGERFARRFWEPGEAVGRRIKFGPPESDAPWITIVGVVDDAAQRGIRESRLDLYVPTRQSPWQLGYLAVRTSVAPASIMPAVRGIVSGLDPRVPVMDVATMGGMVSAALARPRFLSVLLGAFAAAALLLGAMGLYGVLSYATVLRSREMGVRMAIGATRRHVLALIVGWGMRLTALGIAIGFSLAYLVRGVAEGRLYGVATTDPVTYLGVGILFGIVALLASSVPAHRATKVDPLVVLRGE
jgi:predicted permease